MLLRKILPAANQHPAEMDDLSPTCKLDLNCTSPAPSSPASPSYDLYPSTRLHLDRLSPPRNGHLSLGRQAGRLPPVPLHADRLYRKLLFLDIPRSNPSGPPSARFPSAPAEAMGSGLGVFSRQGQQVLPHG